jgi:hypothetical protein
MTLEKSNKPKVKTGQLRGLVIKDKFARREKRPQEIL